MYLPGLLLVSCLLVANTYCSWQVLSCMFPNLCSLFGVVSLCMYDLTTLDKISCSCVNCTFVVHRQWFMNHELVWVGLSPRLLAQILIQSRPVIQRNGHIRVMKVCSLILYGLSQTTTIIVVTPCRNVLVCTVFAYPKDHGYIRLIPALTNTPYLN